MARKSIQDVLADYSVDIFREGSVLRAHCPFHKDTSRPNFTVYTETDSWFCFACSEGGDAALFISKIEGISYGEAKKKIEGVGIAFDELQQEIDGVDPQDRNLSFNDNVNILVSKHCREYLKKNSNNVTDVLMFLKKLDKELEQSVSYQKMKNLIQEAKQLFRIIE